MLSFPISSVNLPDKQAITYLPVEAIRPNPYQPRRHFDKPALDELAASISQYGVLQPLSVRRQTPAIYELIAGERRLRAAKMAGLTYIPAIVLDLNEKDSATIALLENLQRYDLSYMEEAEGYYHLIYHHKMTQEEVASKVGKSQSAIANKLRLLKLPLLVKKMLTDNDLTERHARVLLRLPDEQSQLKALKHICEHGYNVKKAEEYIDSLLKKREEEKIRRFEKKFGKTFLDTKIFVNTIQQAVSLIRQTGADATIKENAQENFVEYIIRIKK